ncbi:hypothetical protein [Kitasatospora terrestris]|uniref:Uncharacterized protein n=1 Tax=Kitasatospora terrestris TaxID=258051 RepID=A0ABP9EEV5_9ACTN
MAFASAATAPDTTCRAAPTARPSGGSPLPEPFWLVTAPTLSHHGTTGIQTFAVRAASLRVALGRAREAAHTETAVLRRRAALIDVSAATATRL